MAVSALGITGLDVPSNITFIAFSAAGLAFGLGAFAVGGRRPQLMMTAEAWGKRGPYLGCVIYSIIVLLCLTLVAYLARTRISNLEDVRAAALGLGAGGADPVFGDPRLRGLFNLVAPGSVIALTILGNWHYYTFGRIGLFVTSAACAIAYSVGLYGRTSVYAFMLLAVVSFGFFASKRALLTSRRRLVRTMILAVVAAPLAFGAAWLSTTTRENTGRTPSEIALVAVHYHTVGFSYMDQELTDPGSWLNSEPKFYGALTIGGVLDAAGVVIRRFEPSFLPPGVPAIVYRQEYRPVGMYEGRTLIYNAYYTFLFTLFADGGWAYVLIGPFAIGVLMQRAQNRFMAVGSFRSFFFCMLTVWLAFMSLFQSAIESSAFWFALGAFVMLEVTFKFHRR